MMAVYIPPNVVLTPDALFTAPLERAPDTGTDWTNEDAMLQIPRANISCVASTAFPSAVKLIFGDLCTNTRIAWTLYKSVKNWVPHERILTYRKLWPELHFLECTAKGQLEDQFLKLRLHPWSSELCFPYWFRIEVVQYQVNPVWCILKKGIQKNQCDLQNE